jgi:hypothetical protein
VGIDRTGRFRLVRRIQSCDEKIMNLDHIRERLANGFEPFVLVMTDGRRFDVPHHDFIAVGKNVVVVLDEKDHSTKIDALHIVSIEDRAARKRK